MCVRPVLVTVDAKVELPYLLRPTCASSQPELLLLSRSNATAETPFLMCVSHSEIVFLFSSRPVSPGHVKVP